MTETRYQSSPAADFIRYIAYSLRERGLWGSIALWAVESIYCVRMCDPKIIDKNEYPADEIQESRYSAGYYPYQGAYYSLVFETLGSLRKIYGPHSIIDIGSGRGRVLAVAEILGFRKIVGVEISAGFISTAEKRLRARKYNFGKHTEFVNINLELYTPQFSADVLFAFNPTSSPIMLRLFERMMQSRVLPKFCVLINPKIDLDLINFGYSIINQRRTRDHIEYSVLELKCLPGEFTVA